MNNLTTRKIVLGILMTLVLAFSVQGIADALTFGTTRTNDLQTIVRGGTFNVTFAVNLETDSLKSAYTAYTASYTDTNGIVYVYDDTNGNSSYNSGEPRTTRSNAYHYNNEAVRISVSGAGARITSIGTNTITPAGSITLRDGGSGAEELVASVQVNCSTSSHGEVTITASDATPSEDYPSGVRRAPNFVLTTYVTQYNQAVGPTKTIRLVGLTNGVAIGYDDQRDQPIYNGDGSHYPVTYTVTGGGTVQIQEGTRLGTAAATLSTSTAAKVLLSMEGVTNTVTAALGGSFETSEGIYIFGNPQLNITGGNNQSGAPNATLTTDLAVTLLDNAGTPTGVVGVPIKFDVTDKSPSGGILSQVTGTTIVNDSNEVISSPIPGSEMYVRTGTGGVATISFQLGTIPGGQTVTASALGIARLTKTIRATATGTPATRQLFAEEIDRQGNTNIYTLVARVENGGQPDPGEVITFTTTKGLLTGKGLNTNGTTVTATSITAKTVYEATNAAGKARVTYNIGDAAGDAEVVASISVVAGSVISQLQEKIFNVRGGGSSQGPQPQPQPQPGAGTLTVSPTSITGAPDSIQRLTIDAGAPNVLVLVLESNEFNNASGGNIVQPEPTDAAGVTTASITLPTAVGSYGDLSLVAQGYPRVPVPVTVTAATTPAALTASPATISGAPGSPQRILATARNAAGDPVDNLPVTFTIVDVARIAQSSGIQNTGVSGIAAWTFRLPTTPGSYTLNIAATGYESTTVSLNVVGVAPATGIRLLVTDGNNQTGEPGTRLSDPLVVTVVDSRRQGVAGQLVQFTVTSGGGRVSPANATTNASGQAQTRLILGRTAGTNTVVATLNGVSITFTATAALAPAFLDIDSGNNQRGTVNNELADPLVAIVEDSSGNGVANVRVDFRVTSGSARLSQRGTGLAARVFTDRTGRAETPLTPTGTGTITVRATATGLNPVEFTITTGPPPASLTKVSGDNQAGNPGSALANPLVVQVQDAEGGAVDGVMVTFEVTAGGGTLSAETATTNAQGRAQTSLTLGSEREINSVRASVTGLDAVTFNTSVDAVIHVAAANRPVMYWIDGGALYRLAGAKAVRIAASANDVAFDMTSGKIYWIEGTSATTGRIHSANVDGTGAAVVKALTSVPMGLAIDGANGKLYLTNSWGKIQRMNVDGSQFETNLIVGLGNPMSIAVASGKVYWTDASGSVRYANTEGTKIVRNIATGSGALGGIAAGSNKVYWTEQTGNATGRIRSANLDGSGIADLFSLTAVPAGIAVDGNNVYWANGWGKVQRRNIDGSKFQDLVTGLMAPGAVAIDGANVATPTPTPTPQPPTTAKSKYDVNNDGTVDNVDVGIVVAATLSGTYQASLDVNDDGKVDLSDVVAISQNVDNSGAAAAPALRTRLSSVQIDRIQEQIDLLLGMNDRSPGALYTLAYLQNLLAVARPAETQLLANYPNPFNPETWIPYELATDTNVKLTIYNAQGIVVRTLELGHQTAGYYTGRDRAAYWDGRNSFGELVASGLYFYQLETDKTSSMRKMVILK